MISLRSLLLTSFTLCSSLPAWAQGQPVTRNQRSSGLTVRELLVGETTAAGGAPVMTVTSDPGAFYVLFSQFAFPSGLPIPLEGAQSLLVPATGPAVLGPLSLTSPAMVNSGLFTDPAGGAVGLIPASGFQDLNFGGPLPAFNLFAIELQALVFNNGVIEFSNAQIRQVIPTGALNPLGFTPGAPVASSSGSGWDDIEQGDVDGDGDLDMIGITQEAGLAGGSVLLWLAENGTYSPAPIVIAPGGQATSAELADFDGDGFLDLAVAYLANPAHLQIFANGGLDPANAWNGFAQVPQASIRTFGNPFITNPSDLEVADTDGDGDLDIFLANALNPFPGEQNRLFENVSGVGGIFFQDITPTNLPVLFDDSEDAEFLDFDLDGDQDIVVANFDGFTSTLGEGVDYIMINQGGLQGGVEGFYQVPADNPIPAVEDESSDVVVGDLDGDGDPDLYFTNWLDSTIGPTGVVFGAPVADRLLINGGLGTYADASFLLPAGDGSGTDAEIADFDLDGTLDIAVGLGSLRTQPADEGVFLLTNPMALAGPLARFDVLVESPDVRDLEVGDWARFDPLTLFQARWFDKDLGVATLGALVPTPGLFPLERD